MTGSLSRARRGWALALIVMTLVCQGFNLTIVSFAGPDIVRAFHISVDALGPLLTATFVGMLIGSSLLGGLGDRIGRRPMIVVGTAAYGLIMLLATLSQAIWQLTLARFAVGLSFGAFVPSAIVLAGELVDESAKARTSSAVTLGISLGSTLAGLAAATIPAASGWRGLFLCAGLLPVLQAMLLWWSLPESPAAALATGDAHARPGALALFRGELGAMTVAVWIIVILLSMTIYLLAGWIPLLLAARGLDRHTASLIGSVYYFGGLLGGIAAALLLGRSNWFVLAAFLFCAALAMALTAKPHGSEFLLVAAIAASGVFVTGAQAAFNGLAATAYPRALRATGLGAALGASRLGSIGGPMLGAWLIQSGSRDIQALFAVPIGPLSIAAAAATWIGARKRSAARQPGSASLG